MAPERRRLALLLGLLGVVMVGAAYWLWPGASTAVSAAIGPRSGGRAPAAQTPTAPEVHLTDLSETRPSPGTEAPRDLFRFRVKARAPREIVAPAPRPVEVSEAPSGPPPPPPIPPIALRFIGLVETTAQAQKIAILSDARGIYQGREGDIIEGRYRILRIGVESVDMAYVDGTGRQTIRLSGS